MSSDTFQIMDAPIWDIKTNWSTRNWLKQNVTIGSSTGINRDGWKPLLVRTNMDSFFEVLKAEANKGNNSKICNEQNKDAVICNIEKTEKAIKESDAFNFLKNSSIWVRLCDNEDWDGDECLSSQPENVKRALMEFEWFKELRLYEFNAAKEYIEYNVRAQKENYIAEFGGHAVHITPLLYGDEVKCRDFFIYNDKAKSDSFEILGEQDETDMKDFHTNSVPIRILVVDDKIGRDRESGEENSVKGVSCNDCQKCNVYKDKKNKDNEPCKLDILRKLLSGKFIINDDKKQGKFKERTYWTNDIKAYCLNKVRFSDVWKLDSNNPSQLKIKENWDDNFNEFNNFIKSEYKSTQVIGVHDVESALVLMSYCKFDIVLLDYLLGERSNTDTSRSYSTDLFEFLSYDFKKRDAPEKTPAVINLLKENNSDFEDKHFKEFKDIVKLNRGPIDKYWIVPMTSYNPSFLADLQRRNVRLIDYRWNISQGADPINTPWRFLYKLNEFLDLQLHQCIFWKSQLLTFLQYTCEDFEEQIKNQKGGSCFDTFQSFMGAEYATFMRLYGSRKLIERDAKSQSPSDTSPFARYIKENFYNKYNYYGVETELNQLMQRFYYRAATMFNERYGRQRLRNAFERMRVFIAYNKLEDSIKDETENNKLCRGLCFLHTVIDSEFNSKIINEWISNNPSNKVNHV